MIDERNQIQLLEFAFILESVTQDICPGCDSPLCCEQIDEELDEWSHWCPDCGFDFIHRRANWKGELYEHS